MRSDGIDPLDSDCELPTSSDVTSSSPSFMETLMTAGEAEGVILMCDLYSNSSKKIIIFPIPMIQIPLTQTHSFSLHSTVVKLRLCLSF
mmetsp:Transcript_27288/g.54683  ORF Transcript_27288/g.54683 Transcript_27288/m.54683 type:complete len:89 (-) Transcript_27288:72-338(-)